MTVREITSIMSGAKDFSLVWEGCLNAFDPENAFHMQSMGDYVVRRVVLEQDNPAQVELEIECNPVKAGRDTLCGANMAQK